ncbi:Sterol desaturase/sphingolipid hydroxylase, fatty acid hydroxylase superfamily [Filimonas lacunae]|uniref:Sterol desaturase/sphingolipid hydroxylase, fatty acid hydroxylase superfamily n=1 Tax=Filimonas lacunae TaxID=477680 RepID=A0A173MMX3_9BACT|nr:sterol desaturase family protein [Filimonas lacunae]BAV09005.1 sterol desaturase [Filimonas lacunae]SIS65658.1 Sterol desaturase/sphingolipid hydroxylase, fatty acid hydroxylase superfamily [Filimonas lacunae]
MGINVIGLAVPFFLFFIGLEYWHCRKKGLNHHSFAESIANLNVGIAERLTDVFTTGLFFYLFTYIYKHFALFSITPHWYTWVLLFLFTDLVWYWYHRLAHEMNIFWAVHVVHHQSEDFNFTVAARITIFQAVVRSLFWSVLPLIGFPPEMITLFLLIHGLYPFFTHTQTIGKLGWIEYLFVTPSHHRVHHSSNEEYLDKNYGDVLIIWDKLFGTFVKEGDSVKITYGLTKPLERHSFLWQHFHFMLEIGYALLHARSVKECWKIIFGKPDNIDPANRDKLEKLFFTAPPARTKNNKAQHTYIIVQTGVSLLLLFAVSLLEKWLSVAQLTIFSAFIIVSLINTGAILEQKKWVFYLEYARLIIVLGGIGYLVQETITVTVLLFLAGVAVCFFRTIQNYYCRYLFDIVDEQQG